MLWLTPFLFPTVVVHAVIAHDGLQAIAWTLLYGTSMLVHGNPTFFHPAHPVTILDKTLCHAITAATALSAARMPQDFWTATVLFAGTYISGVYYAKLVQAPVYDPARWYPWHTSLHFASMAAVHALCHAKRKRRIL